jgi:hypothetical protein
VTRPPCDDRPSTVVNELTANAFSLLPSLSFLLLLVFVAAAAVALGRSSIRFFVLLLVFGKLLLLLPRYLLRLRCVAGIRLSLFSVCEDVSVPSIMGFCACAFVLSSCVVFFCASDLELGECFENEHMEK